MNTIKKVLSFILTINIILSYGFSTYAADSSLNSENPYNINNLIEVNDNVIYNGYPAIQKIIKTQSGETLFNGIISEQNGTRHVYVLENGNIISHQETVMTPPEEITTRGPSSGYNFLMSQPHPNLNIIGNLYGKYSVSYTSTYDFNWSAGTLFSVIVSGITGVFGGAVNVVKILASFGIALVSSSVGVVIDGVLKGKMKQENDRWDYEVWAWNQLGLRTYQTNVYDLLYNSYGQQVDKVYNGMDGDTRSRADICIAGAYYVYIGAL